MAIDASSRDHGGIIGGPWERYDSRSSCQNFGRSYRPVCNTDVIWNWGNWRKKSEPWLGKGVVNNPSKAWDIWYAVQCERSKSGNQLGWRESSMGRCWRCRFQSHLHSVVQSWQSLYSIVRGQVFACTLAFFSLVRWIFVRARRAHRARGARGARGARRARRARGASEKYKFKKHKTFFFSFLVRRCSGGQPSNKYKFKKIKLIFWSGFFLPPVFRRPALQNFMF